MKKSLMIAWLCVLIFVTMPGCGQQRSSGCSCPDCSCCECCDCQTSGTCRCKDCKCACEKN